MDSMVREPSQQSSSADESGYASGESSHESLPEIVFTKPHLKFLNRQLGQLGAEEILRWCLLSLPGLYQTTAFGLTGLVTIDMLSRLALEHPNLPKIELIFLDTLHHFPETLSLVDRVRDRYPGVNIHVFQPQDASTPEEFAALHGENLWDTNGDLYDYVAKVEPAQRAYVELGVRAVLTGRRRSQGGKRGNLDIIEVDEAGLIKINPLAGWKFDDVKHYIDEHNVPYNELLDFGYKSVGDWHSTSPVAADEDERSGRWKGSQKTECGIHNSRSKYAQFLLAQGLLAPQPETEMVLANTVAHDESLGDASLESADDKTVMETSSNSLSLESNAAAAASAASAENVDADELEGLSENTHPSVGVVDATIHSPVPLDTQPQEAQENPNESTLVKEDRSVGLSQANDLESEQERLEPQPDVLKISPTESSDKPHFLQAVDSAVDLTELKLSCFPSLEMQDSAVDLREVLALELKKTHIQEQQETSCAS